MNSTVFRKELMKIMPRYAWTVHRKRLPGLNYLSATGIQTAGFNRLSTVNVVRRDKNGEVGYEVKSSGYGTRSPWLSSYTDGTLARALRGLQKHYETMASTYSSHAGALEFARKKHNKSLEPLKEYGG